MEIPVVNETFQAQLDYATLPKPALIALFQQAIAAHANFYECWQRAVGARFSQDVLAELTEVVYPTLASHSGDLQTVFYEELDFLWQVMPSVSGMLTFARYDAQLLPEHLAPSLDLETLSQEALVLLWNTATLTYVMQTSRWTDLLTQRFDQNTALKLERDAWLDCGGAEDDLLFGLKAAGAEKGNVETLLRGFQFAPGEVGLVDARFTLENPQHGFITHKRCPSKERFGEANKERLESNCVLCVIAMRKSGDMVNENIRCRAVDIPPYKTDPGHACRWEYWLPD